jgi:hypothetical protein
MRTISATLVCMAVLSACAQAQMPAAAQASATVPAPAAIADTEPEVTRQVAAMLQQFGQDALPREQLTDKAQAALAAPGQGAALRACPIPLALDLLARSTKGEDRNYVYRVRCGAAPLIAEISFNKAARVDRLVLRPQR